MNISDFLKIYKILINWFQTTTHRAAFPKIQYNYIIVRFVVCCIERRIGSNFH